MTGRGSFSRVLALAAIFSLVCACGAVAKSTTHSPLPGEGKPTIVLGDKGSTEQLLLGELYAQALRAEGYVVVLEPNIGDTTQINAAFQSGRIDAYPEDLGALGSIDAGKTAPVASETDAEHIAQQYEQAHGGTVMTPVTPFSDAGAAVTLDAFAKQRNLTSIDQLGSLPFHLKFGDFAENETQYSGFGGFQRAYGLTNIQFVPLAAGTSIYDALDTHLVQVGDGSQTDPQLTTGTYAVLSDPKEIFGFHHVALIIRTALLDRLGSQFRQIYSSLTNLLTLTAVQAMKRAVEVDGQVPATVAHAFLLENHLISS